MATIKRRPGLLIRDHNEPHRNQKTLYENALYTNLDRYFRDWMQLVAQRARDKLSAKAAPQLVEPNDIDRLFRIVMTILDQASGAAVNDTADDLGELFNFNMDWTGVNTQAANWARDYAAKLVTNIGDTTKERIAVAVQNYVAGEQTFGNLQKAIEAINQSTFSPERAAMIAQTEITRAFAKANSLAWQASGIVAGKRWNTNHDELVCPMCAPLNGRVIALDSDFGADVFGDDLTEPPAHPNCRCWITPVSDMKHA